MHSDFFYFFLAIILVTIPMSILYISGYMLGAVGGFVARMILVAVVLNKQTGNEYLQRLIYFGARTALVLAILLIGIVFYKTNFEPAALVFSLVGLGCHLWGLLSGIDGRIFATPSQIYKLLFPKID